MAFLRRAGMFDGRKAGFEISRALELEEFLQAYQLVHDCYVERGYIEPTGTGLRLRSFEAMPEMATFVAKINGRVVAVTSVLMDSVELGLPSDKCYAEELAALRARGRRVCEITNLAVHPDYRNTPVFAELTRCCLAHAVATGHDDLFVSVSPEHGAFFGDVLLFEACGGRRFYSEEVQDVVVGMRLDLRTVEARAVRTDETLGEEAFLHRFYYEDNVYHGYVRRWAIQAAGLFVDVDLLRELFVKRGRLFEQLTTPEKTAIRSRWGEDIYEEVVGGSIPLPVVSPAAEVRQAA